MSKTSEDSASESFGMLGTFETRSSDTENMSNVEWRGFGTEEDDEYLANVDLFSSSSLFGQPSYYSPSLPQISSISPGVSSDDYQAMHADDAIFDSFDFDVSVFRSQMKNNPYLPLSAPTSSRPVLKKSWRDVVGTENEHLPLPPTPVLPPKREEPTPPKQEVKEVCRYWLNGNCIYGDKCWYAHSKTPVIPNQPIEYTTECSICQEDVLQANKRFGLLQNCNHVFCLECIRNWRYSHVGDPNVRKCPICKATSFYVIPSNIPIFDPEMKQHLIETYKENMSKIPCKHFNGGYGVCPFGDCCFYSHKLANGQDYSARMVMQSDGELRDIGCSMRLGDFFVQKQKQKKQKKKKVKHIVDGAY